MLGNTPILTPHGAALGYLGFLILHSYRELLWRDATMDLPQLHICADLLSAVGVEGELHLAGTLLETLDCAHCRVLIYDSRHFAEVELFNTTRLKINIKMRFPKQKQLIQLLSNTILKCKCKCFATKALPCPEAWASESGIGVLPAERCLLESKWLRAYCMLVFTQALNPKGYALQALTQTSTRRVDSSQPKRVCSASANSNINTQSGQLSTQKGVFCKRPCRLNI